MADTTTARPYARALFQLAQQDGTVDSWSQHLALMGLMMQDPNTQLLLDHPKLSRQQKADYFLDLLNAAKEKAQLTADLGDKLRHWIQLLAEYKRTALLPAVESLFQTYRAEAEGFLDAEVISAQATTSEQEQALADSLKKRLGREIRLTSRVDESLLGGAIIRAGDWVVDGSLKGRLHRLASTMQH